MNFLKKIGPNSATLRAIWVRNSNDRLVHAAQHAADHICGKSARLAERPTVWQRSERAPSGDFECLGITRSRGGRDRFACCDLSKGRADSAATQDAPSE
jgi:hypothetical protein